MCHGVYAAVRNHVHPTVHDGSTRSSINWSYRWRWPLPHSNATTAPNMWWVREPGARIRPDRALDAGKVQAPGAVACPGGGWRLYYTAIGPGGPFEDCQGYILSAFSEDGLHFRKEEGIRLAPRPDVPHGSVRLLAPSVVPAHHPTRPAPAPGWRMFVESRGTADRPTVITRSVAAARRAAWLACCWGDLPAQSSRHMHPATHLAAAAVLGSGRWCGSAAYLRRRQRCRRWPPGFSHANC